MLVRPAAATIARRQSARYEVGQPNQHQADKRGCGGDKAGPFVDDHEIATSALRLVEEQAK
jgi:hypothetical protein